MNFMRIFSINCKHAQSLTQIKNVFPCSKHFKLRVWTILVFFKQFFYTKCAPFFLKIGKDFNIDVRRLKGVDLTKTVSIIDLNTFG
jgi:hypothetical protein